MDFTQYQEETKKTAIYPNRGDNLSYPALGLTGEAGEVADKVKKIIRDDQGVITAQARHDIIGELGDVLWYLTTLATELKVDLEQVAIQNIRKIKDRKKRGVISGSGDNR